MIFNLVKLITRIFGKKGEGFYENYWLRRDRNYGVCLYYYEKDTYISIWARNGSIWSKRV